MTNCIRALPYDITILIAEKSCFYQAICLAYLSHKKFVKEAVRKRIVRGRYGPFEGLILSFDLLWKIHTNDMEGGFLSFDGKTVDISPTKPGEGREILFDVYRRSMMRQNHENIKNLDQYLSATRGKDLFQERMALLFKRTVERPAIQDAGMSYWLFIGKNIHFTYIETPLIGGSCDIRLQKGVAVFSSNFNIHDTLKTAIIFAEIFYKDPREKVVIKCDQNTRNAFYAIGLLPFEINREYDLKSSLSHNKPYADHYNSFISETTLSKKLVAAPFYEERRKKYLKQEMITNWDPEIFRRYLYKRP